MEADNIRAAIGPRWESALIGADVFVAMGAITVCTNDKAPPPPRLLRSPPA
jgi:hypothetical protein